MSRSRNKKKTVPVSKSGNALVKGEVRVHDLARRFMEVDRRAGGDVRIRLAVEDQDLAAGGVEVRKIKIRRLEGIFVLLPAVKHPVSHSIASYVIEGGEVFSLKQL